MTDTELDPYFPLLTTGARLYILARTDIPQMNPGKGWAQGGHAGTQFVFDVLDSENEKLTDEMDGWCRQSQSRGFGVKITLAATEIDIRVAIQTLKHDYNLQTGIIIDDTYPMTNHFGVPFTRAELTSGYVFAPTDTPQAALDYLRKFELHP
jgi:peptidyl-tRNA hydrolase